MRLTGYAAVFNSRSGDLGFIEVLKPGSFDRALREKHDVRALVNHDANLILGRSTTGTLKLSADHHGLRVTIDLPETTLGRDTYESVRRGDYTQMSFAFAGCTAEWSVTADDRLLRTITEVGRLYDCSVVCYPAYEATSVGVRADAGVEDYRMRLRRMQLQIEEDDIRFHTARLRAEGK